MGKCGCISNSSSSVCHVLFLADITVNFLLLHLYLEQSCFTTNILEFFIFGLLKWSKIWFHFFPEIKNQFKLCLFWRKSRAEKKVYHKIPCQCQWWADDTAHILCVAIKYCSVKSCHVSQVLLMFHGGNQSQLLASWPASPQMHCYQAPSHGSTQVGQQTF